MEGFAPSAPDRVRNAVWARVEQRLPVSVVGFARDVIAGMVDPILDAFFEWHAGRLAREKARLRLAGAGHEASGKLAWALIDEVVVCIVEAIVGDAEEHAWIEVTSATRGALEVTNLFYDGYWVFEGRSGYEQALRFGRLAERMPSPVFLADGEGRITFTNAALVRLLRTSADDLAGRRFESVFGHELVVHPEHGLEVEVACDVGDDQLRHLSITVLMIPGEDEFEYFGAVEDRTHAVVLEQTRDQVVATISHELRTPLTAVLGYTELLIAGDTAGMTDDERSSALHTMRDEAELLLRLVHDLVDFTHLETGRLAVEPSVFLLHEALDAAARRTFLGAGVGPRMQVEPDLKARADRRRLEQVLTNLLTNAQRYGGPSVVAEAYSQGGDLVIRIHDDGPGIPLERRDRVFETFYQGHDRVGLGAGIGLAVCRAVVRAHGGTIRLEDTPGALFVIELPGAVA